MKDIVVSVFVILLGFALGNHIKDRCCCVCVNFCDLFKVLIFNTSLVKFEFENTNPVWY